MRRCRPSPRTTCARRRRTASHRGTAQWAGLQAYAQVNHSMHATMRPRRAHTYAAQLRTAAMSHVVLPARQRRPLQLFQAQLTHKVLRKVVIEVGDAAGHAGGIQVANRPAARCNAVAARRSDVSSAADCIQKNRQLNFTCRALSPNIPARTSGTPQWRCPGEPFAARGWQPSVHRSAAAGWRPAVGAG